MLNRIVLKALFQIVMVMALLATLSACSANSGYSSESSDATVTTTTAVAETSDSTPIPVPTYAPGTELYGLLSVTGEVVIEPQYESLDLFTEDGLARFEDHGLWGFVNADGDEAIPAQYEDSNGFSEGLAAVKVDGLWGFIDVNGTMVIKPQFEGVEGGFKFGRCVISADKLRGLINLQGDIVCQEKFLSISLCCERYFAVEMSSGYGVADQDGNIIVDCSYQKIYDVTNSGYFFVYDGSALDRMISLDGTDYLIFWYFSEYYEKQNFNIGDDSVILCYVDELFGLFDLSSGSFIINPRYEKVHLNDPSSYITLWKADNWMLFFFEDEKYIESSYRIWRVSGDYIVIEDEETNLFGIIDLDGTLILPPEYDSIEISDIGEFSVIKDDKSAVLDSKGIELVPWQSQYWITYYLESSDCWTISLTGQEAPPQGLMNRKGDVILEPQIWITENDPTIAYNDKSFMGLLGSSGYIADCEYLDLHYCTAQDVLVIIDQEKHFGLMDTEGNILFEPQECKILINRNEGVWIDAAELWSYGDTINNTRYFIFTIKVE